MYEEFKSLAMQALMFLESLFASCVTQKAHSILQIVILHINMLLSLANNTLDLQALFENRFIQRREKFSPKEAIEFVQKIFNAQSKL